MSETVQFTPEHNFPAHETLEVAAQQPEHAAEQGRAEQKIDEIDAIRHSVEQASTPAERLALPVDETHDGSRPLFINRELKVLALRRSLKQIRRQLPLPQRALSRVVHQPAVRIVSEAADRTVARPSGLLGGGITAFVGSLLYLYFTRHIGLSYNYLLFTLFFVGGFVVGLAIELLLALLHPKHPELDA